MQRMIAAAFVVAGVFVLAGLGWALLAAGAVLWVRDDRAVAWLRVRAEWARVMWGRLVQMPRQAVSGTSMGVGLVLAPVGVAVFAGIGLGLAVAGVMLVGFGLLSGWNV